MSSFGVARRGDDHDSVHKLAEFDKPIHRQPRISYNLRQARLGRHPGGENKRRSILPPHKDMFDAAVQVLTGQNKRLPDQRMKRIGDRDFLRRNPGTMTPLRTKAVDAPPPSTRSSRPPSSTTSIRRLGSPTSWRGCRTTRPSGSTSSCPGTGSRRTRKRPPRSRRQSQSKSCCQRPSPRSSPDAYGLSRATSGHRAFLVAPARQTFGQTSRSSVQQEGQSRYSTLMGNAAAVSRAVHLER
jgi:hypothetical protein